MKFIQSPQFWLVVVVLLAGAGIVLAVVRSRNQAESPAEKTDTSDQKGRGFMDVVKNPEDWKQGLDESDRALERAFAEAIAWDDGRVDKKTRRFLFDIMHSQDAWAAGRVLRSLGARVHPTLFQCLRDDTLRGRLSKPTGKDAFSDTPFKRLCDLLAENPPPECVPALSPFLDDPATGLRKEAALVIGCVGSADCVPPLRKALADSDEFVRSYAIIGLQRAHKAKHLDDACRRDLFADVQALIGGGKNVGAATELLLHFDEQRAVEYLRSDPILTAEFDSLHDVLRVLSDKRIAVERGRLLGILGALRSRDLRYPVTYQLGETLRALGRHRVPEDRSVFETYLTHGERTVASGAADGALASHGLDDYQDRIWNTVKERGVGALTEAQRHHYAVTIFDGEVNNGGLSQYFFNSSGDDWRAAVAGLEAMGSRERLAILREAVAKFGPGGPSTNRDERIAQLARIVRSDEGAFTGLDARYYKSTEVLNVLTMRYVLGRPEAFR